MKKRTKHKRHTPVRASSTTIALFARHIYSGYMQFVLEGARDTSKFFEHAIFTGDWRHDRIRREILGMSRHYKFEIVLYGFDGVVMDGVEYYPDEPLNHTQLTETMKQMYRELMGDKALAVDLYQSYFRVATYNPKEGKHL